MKNPAFDAVLRDMGETHDRKNQDYADEGNPYSNFEGAAKLANVSVPTVFQTLIGIKVERLRQLTSGKDPNFESVEDTILDLANYAALWLSYLRRGSGDVVVKTMPEYGPITPYSELLKPIRDAITADELDIAWNPFLGVHTVESPTPEVPALDEMVAEEHDVKSCSVCQMIVDEATASQDRLVAEGRTTASGPEHDKASCDICQAIRWENVRTFIDAFVGDPLTGDPWLDGLYDPPTLEELDIECEACGGPCRDESAPLEDEEEEDPYALRDWFEGRL